MMLKASGATGDELLQRDILAHQLMYLTRGQPVIYYGDEQGFTGAGGDKDARQDMFASKTAQYNDEDVIVGSKGSRDRYDTSSPLYRSIGQVAALRKAHPALADGAQIAPLRVVVRGRVRRQPDRPRATRSSTSWRQQRDNRQDGQHRHLRGAHRVRASARLEHPAEDRRRRARRHHRAATVGGGMEGDPADRPAPGGACRLLHVAPAGRGRGRPDGDRRLGAREHVRGGDLRVPPAGHEGVDDARHRRQRPYRVFHDVSAIEKGTMLEYRAVLLDSSGNVSATSTHAVVGRPGTSRDPQGRRRPDRCALLTRPSASQQANMLEPP